MADPPVTNDASLTQPDATKDVQAQASIDASNKALTELHPILSGPAKTGTDGASQPTDNTNGLPTLESTYDAIAHFASEVWSGNDAQIFQFGKSGDAAKAADQNMDTGPSVAGADKGAAGKGSDVVVQDHQIAVTNDKVAATRAADGTDTVNVKATGEVVTRDPANHSITDVAADRTTKIDKDHVDDKFADIHIRRNTKDPLPTDGTQPNPGEAQQGKDGIAYSDAAGNGTATARSDNTITLQQANGDQIVINSNPGANGSEVTYTEKGGQPQTMTLEEFKAAHGEQFANFKLDGAGQVTNVNDGVVVQAHDTSAALAKTNPTTQEAVQANVNADGTSELKHVDGQGAVVSDTKINYNDPTHAYQQLDSLGNVTANFDVLANVFQGNGFAFNDSGMQVGNGNVFISDNGLFSADSLTNFISSDNSLSSYIGDGSTYGSMCLDTSTSTGLSTDVQADVASQLASVSDDVASGDVSALVNLDQLAGGKLNLAPLIEKAEEKEEWEETKETKKEDLRNAKEDFVAARLERKDTKDNLDSNYVLDFGSFSDLYGSFAA